MIFNDFLCEWNYDGDNRTVPIILHQDGRHLRYSELYGRFRGMYFVVYESTLQENARKVESALQKYFHNSCPPGVGLWKNYDKGPLHLYDLDEDNPRMHRVMIFTTQLLRQAIDCGEVIVTYKERNSLAIGGLDVNDDKERPKKKSVTKGKRTRRRRIEIDKQTELSSEHIKGLLRDTSDIVRQNRSHPADNVVDANEESRLDLIDHRPWRKQKGLFHEEIAGLPYEKLFARPNIGDDGSLAPELLLLWERNAARLRGEALPSV